MIFRAEPVIDASIRTFVPSMPCLVVNSSPIIHKLFNGSSECNEQPYSGEKCLPSPGIEPKTFCFPCRCYSQEKSLSHPGVILGYTEVILTHPGFILGSYWVPLDHLWSSWCHPWVTLGSSWGYPGVIWVILGLSWIILGDPVVIQG